ncbi:hypothetical protein PM3016_4187 [Paenibacillus mucilaginosus 3016]|uniref:DUF1468 domain-containing protein n=2 Tax=Paenibacillus mucilaginosus TaxID=61624 RepID=H6NLM9_9BACL|nr:tripartite tricarboxylate transporter TctB family protein [Paenibacillus mucilaginosus]AFC30963.1 hypothetical protein PM3016_4187 [Paenibacillus mucilaginosus 3016]AFH63281.1 hypothetical protein B2K_21715 [Paenibacillus mucilaginosus K02]WFA19557.1 tripartite tricarboxylate transporter TctB family protein [Paenibacillus mucilaginosus]
MRIHGNLGFMLSLLFTAGSGILFLQSWELDYYTELGPGPGLFPRWLSGALLVVSVLYMIGSLRQPVLWSAVMPQGRDLRSVAMVLASAALFVALLSMAGFVLAGGVTMTLLLARSYPWLRASAIALSVNVLIYYAFSGWLDVPLPSGQLWEWVG